MCKRANGRALRVSTTAQIVAMLWFASVAHAQQPSLPLQAYEQLVRRVDYLRGFANPYVNQKADFFGGIDAASETTFLWMGATYAPFGILADDGWRIRVMGGAGVYRYRTPLAPEGINDANVFSGELLAGYRKTFRGVFGQTLYVGAFAGLHYEDQILVYDDPFNAARGSEGGIKGSIELYSRIHERYIASAFATVSSVHSKYQVKAVLLRELSEMWAIGGEAALLGDARYNEQRIGPAVALTWRNRIFTLSAGALQNSGRGDGAYLTFSVYSPL